MLEEESNSATWELSKENILPLKQGRKANILSLALDDSSTSKLSSVRHEFEEELRTYTGDDPLDVWYRYVLWVEQNYPKGGKDSNLMKLIQKCVTSIHTNASTNEKYKNDDRFLTLWVKYANLCPNPLEVYGALDTKGLCTGIAEFYLNWSWEYEKLKNYRKAESIFQKGFQSGALPLDALQEAHKKFQTRVARATLEEMDSEAEGNVAEPQRTVLTSLKVQGRKNRVANERTGSSILGPAGRIPSTQTSINAGASSFSIYQDSSACGGTSGKGSGVDVKRGSLPVGNSLHKENVKEAGPWTKAKASQKSTGVVPVDDVDMYQKPMFTVHQDADGDIAYRTPSKHPEMNNVLSVRKTFEDDDWQVPLFVAEPSDPKVKPQYCKDKVYCGTEEFSFEELMAARYFKIQKEKEMKKQEEEKDAQIKKMEDMLKKQQQMIQQLLQVRQEQAVKPPDIIVSSHDENDAACVAASHKLKCEQTRDRSMYQDSWICMNKSVGASINASANNVSHFFDESSTHALLQLKPATLTLVDEFPEDAYCAPGPGTNVSGQDVSGSSHSNSRGLSMTDPTVNTKMALHTVNDMWSGSLFRDDSVTANTDDPVPVKEKLPFTIVKDDHKRQEDVGICKGTSLAFTIYSDGDNQKKCVPQSSESLALVKDDTSTKAKCLATQEELYPENQNENLPPMGYQQEKEVRTLAGILQPATNVPFIPLEEQLKEEEEQDEEAASDDKEINDDDDEYVILQNRPSMADLTLKMPFSSEAFAKNAKIVSTPAAWVLEEAPKVTITDNGSVTAFKVADHFPLVNEVQEKDDPEEKDSGELMPPPDKIWPSTTLEYKPKGEFSPIMETSREYISSSSSSGNSATSTMLGASLPSSLTHCAGLSASQTSRSRHCSNAQAEGGLEQVTGSQTGDFTKSGYLADKSRGESLADSRPSAAPYQSNALGDEEFMFNPVEAAAAMLEMEKLPSSAPPTGTKETLKDSNATEVKEAPSINFPDKINPFDNALIGQLLSNLNENVENRGGFIQMSGKLPLVKPNMQITLGQEFFRVRRLQGEGAYAKVYQATTVDPMNVTVLPSLNDSDEEDENDELQMILKIQKPACLWEFYICHELRRRLKANAASEQVLDSVMRINRGYIYANGSILVNQYHKYGTLLDMVNGFKSNGRGVPEDIAMYYMIEVLSIVEHLHNCQIIHADIKPDNFVVRDMPNISVTAKSPDEMFQFSPCSLKLIDFGRSIDMKLLPEGTTFTEKVTTEGFTCCEMREGLPWTYQTDLFGIASIAYCLLFGSYMDVKKGPSGKWELKGATIKRYWVEHLWNELFSTLLNVPSCSSLPNLSALKKKFMMCIFEKKLERELTGNIQKLNVILLQKK